MRRYIGSDTCLMAFLRRELDDPEAPAPPCGRCAPCTGRGPQLDVPAEEVAEAAEWLRSSELVIEPRQRWMTELPGMPLTIPVELRLSEGRSLSVYDGGGWGSLVRSVKFGGGAFSEDLVQAAARLVRRWSPTPAPEWVTCVPSAGHPPLVSELARRLAEMLGLPFREAVRRVRPSAPQKEMENSAQQSAMSTAPSQSAGDCPGGRCFSSMTSTTHAGRSRLLGPNCAPQATALRPCCTWRATQVY